MNELIRNTSFTLTIYTVHYPQDHLGPQANGRPLTATPFLFDRRDDTPVYRQMYQAFSDNLQDRQPTEASLDPQHTLAATAVTRGEDGSTSHMSYRTIRTFDQKSVENTLQWWWVILIQNGQDQGFTQAGPGYDRTVVTEVYTGHVLEVRIETTPTTTVGTVAQNIFRQCYTQGSEVPTSDSVYYTLGSSSRHSNLNQRQT